MLTGARALCVIAMVLGYGVVAQAEDWPAPQVTEVFSASRDHFVRILPGKSLGETVGSTGDGLGTHATAELYERRADQSYSIKGAIRLLNPIAPAEYFVSNDGRLATIDNWQDRGYGNVVAIYDPEGKLAKAYVLADLFSPAEIEVFSHSDSSIRWHRGPVYINQDQRTLYIMIEAGRDLVIGLETGAFAYCEMREGKYVCRNRNVERRWLPYGDVVPQR